MKNLNFKIKSSSEGTWMFQDFTNSKNLYTYGLLTYDYYKNILTGYIFIDSKQELEDLTSKINDGKGPNNYLDFCFIVISNKELLKTAKWIFNYWNKNIPLNYNLGLYFYDENSDGLQELIPAKQNVLDIYLNYIKDVEVNHVKNLYLNQTKNFSNLSKLNNDEIDFINYKESELVSTNPTKKVNSNLTKEDSYLPSWAKNFTNYDKNNYEPSQSFFNNEHENLVNEFNKYESDLNSTHDLFNEFNNSDLIKDTKFNDELSENETLDFNKINHMADILKTQNDNTTDPIVVDNFSNIEDEDNGLLNSEYLSKLDEITENLKTNDFSEQTKMILEEFDLNNKE